MIRIKVHLYKNKKLINITVKVNEKDQQSDSKRNNSREGLKTTTRNVEKLP